MAENELWNRRIREGLITHFAEVRFTKMDNGEPSFPVNYFMSLKEKYDIRYIDYGFPGRWESMNRWGRWYGWNPPYGHVDVWHFPYTESTMVVDVIDSRA